MTLELEAKQNQVARLSLANQKQFQLKACTEEEDEIDAVGTWGVEPHGGGGGHRGEGLGQGIGIQVICRHNIM